MKRSIILLLLLANGAIAAFAAGKPLVITRNGASGYRIVVAVNASANDLNASATLQSYLKRISGAELPVVTEAEKRSGSEIVVGFSNRTDVPGLSSIRTELAPDGYRIVTRGKTLYILGVDDKGNIYGVIALLEKLGCRKYSPSVEVVPVNPDIILEPLNLKDQPATTFRVINGSFCRDKAYCDWQRLDNTEDVFASGYYVHTFNRLVPWETYFQSHPEYYALMNGKRIIDQLCLSNPEVLRLTIERLKKEMASQPDKKLWSVSQNDNFSYCQCPECSKVIAEEGSPSGPIIRFVNKVAGQFPDKVISTLAYQFSRKAPKLTKPLDNVQIMLCTIELNRALSIESDPSSRSFRDDIVDWGKISKHIYLWDYTVNFSHHISPFPNIHVLQPNIQFFVRNGALEHFQQSNNDAGHEFSELKSYLISRLLWNPDINADSVINEFLSGYYGDAAPFIRQYIDLMQQEYLRSGQVLDIYASPVWNANASLSADNMAIYNYLFDKAEDAVTGKPGLISRVKVARLPIQYAAMEIGKNDMFGPRGWYTSVNGRYILRPKMKAMLESFNATCKANQVRTINEAGLTPEEYYQSTLRFIDVKIDNNLAFQKKVTASPLPSSKYGNGDLTTLTNGVQGANDYKVHWLGWEARDFQLTLDLEKTVTPKSIRLGTLYDPKSWILHPVKVSCETSADGITWFDKGTILVEGDQKKEEVTRTFRFENDLGALRYVRFSITGTRTLPVWHPSAGGDSWVFVDEIVVE